MEKKIIAACGALTEKNKETIARTAAGYGYKALFFDHEEDALNEAANAEILYCGGTRLMAAAREARWICCTSAGVDYVLKTGLPLYENQLLTNSAGAFGVTISEHIVMVLLELLRKKPAYDRIVKDRKWTRDLPIRSIRGSRITILGTGDLGTEAALRLRGFFPAAIIGINRSGKYPGTPGTFDDIRTEKDLEPLLPETDILILCLPGTKKTDDLMSLDRLLLLPPHAVIVNVGRGNALDQKALASLLEQERLAGAALDVFQEEPIPQDDPLWNCKNLIITPHISGNMTLDYTVDRNTELFCEDLVNYCEGRPLKRLVSRSEGY